jgi:hypothetical protein
MKSKWNLLFLLYESLFQFFYPMKFWTFLIQDEVEETKAVLHNAMQV